MGKFVRWDVLDGRLSWSFDQDKIVAEKLFDGCYIVRRLPAKFAKIIVDVQAASPSSWKTDCMAVRMVS